MGVCFSFRFFCLVAEKMEENEGNLNWVLLGFFNFFSCQLGFGVRRWRVWRDFLFLFLVYIYIYSILSLIAIFVFFFLSRGSEEKEGGGELVIVRKVVVTANPTQPLFQKKISIFFFLKFGRGILCGFG